MLLAVWWLVGVCLSFLFESEMNKNKKTRDGYRAANKNNKKKEAEL